MSLWTWLRRRGARQAQPPTLTELPIVPPRYSCRLTGECFARYSPVVQAAALRRRSAAEEMRAKASRVETGDAQMPLQEVKRRA